MRAVALDEAGLLETLRAGAVWFDLSTNSPKVVREVHVEALKRGIHLLDAPVSGGPLGARTGELAVWVGGDAQVFEESRGGARCDC